MEETIKKTEKPELPQSLAFLQLKNGIRSLISKCKFPAWLIEEVLSGILAEVRSQAEKERGADVDRYNADLKEYQEQQEKESEVSENADT